MKKVIIVTDGARLRAFRFSDRLRGREFSLRCAEIRPADPGSAAGQPPEAGLSEIAGQVSKIMAEEDPFILNLAAPRDLLPLLLRRLDQNAGERLTRTVPCDLTGASLTEIALRFPPTPCQKARPVRRTPKRRRRATATSVDH